jgi:hypothetical protein
VTDLDHQIARSKGWTHVPAGTPPWKPGEPSTTPEGYRGAGLFHLAPDCCWSTDDAKALELVDEVRGKLEFVLKTHGGGWFAYFLHLPSCQTMDGEAPTRPEAISRAYLAAMAWMRGRG